MGNVGTLDSIVRMVLGTVALILAFTVFDVTQAEAGGIALAAVGALLLLTGATGYCLIYSLFHISTNK